MLRQYWENRLRLLDLFNQHCDSSTVRWVDLFWTRWAAPKVQYPFPYLFQRVIEGLYNAEADYAVQMFMAMHYPKVQVRDAAGLVLISLTQCDGPYFPSETNREQLAWVMLEQFKSLSIKSAGLVATHLHVHTHGEWHERVTKGWYAGQEQWIGRSVEEYTAYLVERKRADANFFSLTDTRQDVVSANLKYQKSLLKRRLHHKLGPIPVAKEGVQWTAPVNRAQLLVTLVPGGSTKNELQQPDDDSVSAGQSQGYTTEEDGTSSRELAASAAKRRRTAIKPSELTFKEQEIKAGRAYFKGYRVLDENEVMPEVNMEDTARVAQLMTQQRQATPYTINCNIARDQHRSCSALKSS